MIEPIIRLNSVAKVYKTEAGDFSALKHIDLAIEPGQFVGVIGKSGSGKSTLINMVTGIDRATSGQIVIAGTDVTHLKEGDMAVWRGKHLGIVFQFFQLLPTLTVIENIMLPMDFCNMYPARDRREKALDLLRMVELADQADKFPSELSGGQQQRIAIARSLANDPPIICADEPTGNLDSKTAEQIFELFRNLVNQGKTIIMVTHDKDLVKKVDRSVIIADGQVIEEYLMSTFSTLDQKQLVWVTENTKSRDYKPGETIINEGDKTDEFFVVMQGTVDVLVSVKGREKKIETFSKGQYFGEIEMVHGVESVATVRAGVNGARIGSIGRREFELILKDSPETKAKMEKRASNSLKNNQQAKSKSV